MSEVIKQCSEGHTDCSNDIARVEPANDQPILRLSSGSILVKIMFRHVETRHSGEMLSNIFVLLSS